MPGCGGHVPVSLEAAHINHGQRADVAPCGCRRVSLPEALHVTSGSTGARLGSSRRQRLSSKPLCPKGAADSDALTIDGRAAGFIPIDWAVCAQQEVGGAPNATKQRRSEDDECAAERPATCPIPGTRTRQRGPSEKGTPVSADHSTRSKQPACRFKLGSQLLMATTSWTLTLSL